MAVCDAVVLAAGRGVRLGGPVPKQFRAVDGRAVVARAVDAFLDHPAIRRVVVAIAPGDETLAAAALGQRAVRVVTGGSSRQASSRAALAALLDDDPPHVLIHDAARPFVSPALISRVVAALERADAVVPAVPVSDTLKRVDGSRVVATVPREALVRAQTPQGFRTAALRAAHGATGATVTDDAALMEAAGHAVVWIEGERSNVKITVPEDVPADEGSAMVPCTGFGFDVHRLAPGGPLTLGGLSLPADCHLVGHSDADVALHALTDALFGALSDGDIGQHFPPSDPRWRGADSEHFLTFAAERARRGGAIAHLDLTIVCERPKIGPVREAMRARIAAIAGVPPARVSVKATTTEGLGFTGRGEGIAAQAVATVLRRLEGGDVR